MPLARVFSRAQIGIHAPEVLVEVHITNGLPAFTLVGLPDTAVKEAKERVRSALINSGFDFPQRRITVNLAPADLPKDGGRYDLAIAVGILMAMHTDKPEVSIKHELIGELSLNGDLRPVLSVLPSILSAEKASRQIIIPSLNTSEVVLKQPEHILLANTLLDVWLYLSKNMPLCSAPAQTAQTYFEYPMCLSDVKGQAQAKRVLEIAASGNHHMLFMGPPGTGKSMLAQRLATILPPLDEPEAVESTCIYSLIGRAAERPFYERPFRSPHHTCSPVALVGGSSQPRPGEITLAHHGVLFLDELPEYERKVLDSLREPLETGEVVISRAARQVTFPARFQLVAALNPSPTGCHSDKRASPEQVLRYLNRISGPFVDRIDLQVELPKLPSSQLQQKNQGETSAEVRKRVVAAREKQKNRQGVLNGQLTNKGLEQHCALDAESETFLAHAVDKLGLSPRSYHKVLKVARTIADLANEESVALAHIKEAISYRAFERLLIQLTR